MGISAELSAGAGYLQVPDQLQHKGYRITAARLPSLRRGRVVGHRLAIHGRLFKLTSSQIRWLQVIMAALQADALFGPHFLRRLRTNPRSYMTT